MKRLLNPSLILQRFPKDPEVRFFGPPWVVLREPISESEKPIGKMEVELLEEDPEDQKDFLDQWNETEMAFADHWKRPVDPAPHAFMAKEGFGWPVPIRLVIHARQPFAD